MSALDEARKMNQAIIDYLASTPEHEDLKMLVSGDGLPERTMDKDSFTRGKPREKAYRVARVRE